ncbi:hypothetical protein [Mycolicibacterium komossense]|uniref:Uncharacterized protein n=1 Tax=Mycolicibacterium komossense TaxID=1779 RepID=A0ABT3CMT3_9MYCO|nr:hypothetical protein [Mycolicibacterium komossense]MCV7230864.1 hypothetical protein [Mycolicibacterium komossense]
MQDNDFDPANGAQRMASLWAENRVLKSRLRDIDRLSSQELPSSWHRTLTKLRRENGRFRIERNEARFELEALRAEISAGK